MLVLSRRLKQSIVIDDKTTITIHHIDGQYVKLAIDAPPDVIVWRQEVWEQIQADAKEGK